VCTILESQLDSLDSVSDDPTARSQHTVLLEHFNLFFTLLFTVELAVNAYSHWLLAFVGNPWSLLDTFVVITSLVSTVVSAQSTSVVRVLRALRVIRIFGRVKSLRKIITALTMSLLPVLNVFLILFLLISIGARTHAPRPLPPPPPPRRAQKRGPKDVSANVRFLARAVVEVGCP
jgi:hypothetical protein